MAGHGSRFTLFLGCVQCLLITRDSLSGSRRGERGKMCPFKGTEGTKDTLEALEKGLKSERQAAQSRLALVG